MSLTLNHKDISKSIIVDTLVSELRSAAGNSSYKLNDPRSDSRPSKSKFIVSTFPTRKTHYPHVVLREMNDTAEPIDNRHTFYRHTYSIMVEIYSITMTDIYKIRDGVREYLLENKNVLAQDGFQDLTIESSTSADWEQNPEVYKWQMVVQGKVYTHD